MAEQALPKSRSKSRRKQSSGGDDPSLKREIFGILLLALSVLLLLSFATYKTGSVLQPEATNWIGPVGAFLADNFYFTFGLGSYAFVLLTAVSATSLLFGHRVIQSAGHAVGSVMLLLTASGLFTTVWSDAEVYGAPIGGQLGEFISSSVGGLFGETGAIVILSTLMLISLMLVTRTSVIELMQALNERWGGADGENPIRRVLDTVISFFKGVISGASDWFGGVRDRNRERRAEKKEARALRDEEKAARKLEEDDERDARREERAEKKRASAAKKKAETAAAIDPEDSDDIDDEAGTTPIPVKAARHSAPKNTFADAERPSFDDDDYDDFDDDFDDSYLDDVIENPMKTTTRRIDTLSDSANTPTRTPEAKARPSTTTSTARNETPTTRVDPVASDLDESPKDGPTITESEAQMNRRTGKDIERDALALIRSEERDERWQYPPLSYLNYKEPSGTSIDKAGLRLVAEQLEQVLEDFKVKGNVSNICPGPVVTRFEFEPEAGTKLRKISNLSDDIAMALRAEKVRIIAPIPGKGCVGFEIPNEDRETVYLKEMLGSQEFNNAKSKITIALGKDIEGFPVVADLAKMPHLLVAGTTGSGKSVSVNSMIVSMLYNASPDDVRMILIDPKQLEFAVYEDIPHLLLPVVTDPSKAATALQWAVTEMERRYKHMKDLRVRSIDGYNTKLKKMQEDYADKLARGETPSQKLTDTLMEVDDNGRPAHRHLPFIVVVVDEFADLMMVAGKDVETAVARLAQKARAAGIHCILATQRPSVDVLTGLIKANFPTRISFRLMSGIDSRTVLDTMGAENLLGMGDMLFRPPGSSELTRVHGAYVDENEIDDIVSFLKKQGTPDYDETILNPPVEDMIPDEEADEKYDAAVHCVCEAGYASISMVQRKLRVGYNRAARMVDHMERDGIIGPPTGGSSRRDVLVSSY